MSLRGKLKMKEQVEEENEKLKAEISELRNKGIEAEKKKTKYKGEVKELQAVVSSL
jgi:cbb3-type cytochrome oxidase cytochrome c subunit